MNKYLDIAREVEDCWTVIPTVFGALITVHKKIVKEELNSRKSEEELRPSRLQLCWDLPEF